jgi:hypothetical protein
MIESIKIKTLIISFITFCLIAGAVLLTINTISAKEGNAKETQKNEFAIKVAAILNIDSSSVSAAMEQAKEALKEEAKKQKYNKLKSNLDKKVESGVLTQEKADEIYKKFQNGIINGKDKKSQYKLRKNFGNLMHSPQSLNFKSHLENKIKHTSKMNKKYLGKFNKTAKFVTAEELRIGLNKKVESGVLTQEKADEIYKKFQAMQSNSLSSLTK